MSENTPLTNIPTERDVTDMDSLLEEGSTYLLTGLAVKPVRNTEYNTTGHQYELTWTQWTKVTGPLTKDTVKLNYNLVPLSQVAKLDVDTMVDVLGWVQEARQPRSIITKGGKNMVLRELILADQTANVELTLWAEKAENFSSEGRVLTVKGARVNKHQGKKTLWLNFSGGSYEMEPEVAHCKMTSPFKFECTFDEEGKACGKVFLSNYRLICHLSGSHSIIQSTLMAIKDITVVKGSYIEPEKEDFVLSEAPE